MLPILAPHGKPNRFVRFGRDVTLCRRAEQELAAAQRLLASIFRVVDQGLAVIDETGTITRIFTKVKVEGHVEEVLAVL